MCTSRYNIGFVHAVENLKFKCDSKFCGAEKLFNTKNIRVFHYLSIILLP